MSNLGTWTIKESGYTNLATKTGISFVNGTIYIIQSYDNDFYIREGSDGDGFYVKAKEKVEFKSSGTALYVKPALVAVKLNIAN